MSKQTISVVFPVYNEAGNIEALYKEITKVFRPLKKRYDSEFIFVNDGSSDDSWQKLLNLAKKDKRVAVINFSRNFGHQIAITAGLDYASGDAVITMDSDLQDPPKVCTELIKKWEKGYAIVYAQYRKRSGESIFKRLSAKWFYKIINRLTETEIPQNVGDFRLLDRVVVDQLKKFGERQRFLRGLVSYVGFKQGYVPFDRQARDIGKTSYSLSKMIRLATDGILSFSTVPIRFISRLGYLISFLSLLVIIYAVWLKVFRPELAVPGWAFVTVSIFFIGGVQLIILGLLGLYIAHTYTEVQNRPLYIISSIEHRQPRNKQPLSSKLSSK